MRRALYIYRHALARSIREAGDRHHARADHGGAEDGPLLTPLDDLHHALGDLAYGLSEVVAP